MGKTAICPFVIQADDGEGVREGGITKLSDAMAWARAFPFCEIRIWGQSTAGKNYVANRGGDYLVFKNGKTIPMNVLQ